MARDIKAIAAAPERLYPWQSLGRDKARTIGVLAPCYGSSHVIYGLGSSRYTHRTLPILPLRKLDRGVTFFQFTPVVIDARVPLVHSWNAVPLNKDFIVSFELELPRYLGGPSDAQIRRGLRLLDSPRCRKILALSEFARRFAMARFERYGFDHLAEKLSVFRGGVPDVSRDVDGYNRDTPTPFAAGGPLRLIVLGTNLFHKGGMHAILAGEALRARGVDVRLTLVGDFELKSPTFREGLPDAAAWRARAVSHDWIRFAGPIPHARVASELAAHDLCIYTSLDESLGWLPIEAGMLGVPVVATNVCALPELIADQESGWLVPLPLRADGRWAGLEVTGAAKIKAVEDANARIVSGIERCVLAVRDDPSMLTRWGKAARARALANYGMDQARDTLDRTYDDVLSRGR